MKKRISRISVHKSSLALAVCLASALLVANLLQIPMALTRLEGNVRTDRIVLLLLGPFFAAIAFYILGAVAFLIYTLFAKKFGGIEVELDDTST